MKKNHIVFALIVLTVSASAQNNQPSPIFSWGAGLDGSTYQKTAIYSDATYGLLIEAPLNSSSGKLPIQFNWRGSGTPPLYINANSNVGIGTSSPLEKLDVNGRIFKPDDQCWRLGHGYRGLGW
jgi:hypothetical protein